MSQRYRSQEVSSNVFATSYSSLLVFPCLSVCFMSPTPMDRRATVLPDTSSGLCLHVSRKLRLVMGLSVAGASPEGAVSYSSVRQCELALNLTHSWARRQNLADEENTWENICQRLTALWFPVFARCWCPQAVQEVLSGTSKSK